MRTRLRRARCRLGKLRHLRHRAIILLYHSISPDERCPWSLCVPPDDFAGHLEVLSRRAHVVPLSDLLAAVESGAIPDRSVAITFDDGYADNLLAAKPALERFDTPATVFVTAGMLGSQDEFWWDELSRLTLCPDRLPRIVRLSIQGRPFSFEAGPDSQPPSRSDQRSTWRFHQSPPTRRHELYRILWRRLQPISEPDRRSVLAELGAQVGAVGSEPARRRIMSTDELVTLAADGLVDVGAHTMSHPVLSRLPEEDQQREISASKERLECILGRAVDAFSYPHGGRRDYDARSVRAARAAGLRSACTTAEGWVHPGSDVFQLPRIHVPPCDAGRFERLLDAWL